MYGYIDVWTKQANKAPCSNEPGSQVAPMRIYTPLSPGLFPTNPDRILLHINKAQTRSSDALSIAEAKRIYLQQKTPNPCSPANAMLSTPAPSIPSQS